MVDAFIGSHVSLLLKEGSVSGIFSDFDADSKKLTLTNVTAKHDGVESYLPTIAVRASDIQDLTVLPTAPSHKPTASPTSRSTEPDRNHAAHQRDRIEPSANGRIYPNSKPTNTKNAFVDPAILSFKQLSPRNTAKSSSTQHSTPSVSSESSSINHTSANQYATEDASIEVLDYSDFNNTNQNRNGPSQQRQRHTSDSSTGYESAGRNKRRGKKGQNKPQPSPSTSRRSRPVPPNEWANGNVDDFIEEEFDFQSNLGLFDKAKVFAEMKQSDEIAPETRLVHINRLPQERGGAPAAEMLPVTFGQLGIGGAGSHGNAAESSASNGSARRTPKKNNQPQRTRQNIAPTENVLETSRNNGFLSNGGEAYDEGNDAGMEESETENGVSNSKNTGFRTLSGVDCPTVTVEQMLQAEQLAYEDTGPNEDQMAENAGRSICQMSLQALGGNRRMSPTNHNGAPLVIVLCGNNKIGSYGLVAARHLANHGCQVAVYTIGKQHIKSVSNQRRILLPTGAKTMQSLADLPGARGTPVELIIDALLGMRYVVKDLASAEDRKTTQQLIRWANDNKAPVLSIDCPSNARDRGQQDFIESKFTLCLGAPKEGLRDRTMTGEVFLADVGIPLALWKRADVRNWSTSIFGCDYIAALEYVSA